MSMSPFVIDGVNQGLDDFDNDQSVKPLFIRGNSQNQKIL